MKTTSRKFQVSSSIRIAVALILPDDCSSEIRMEDRAYMRSLVESMPRRLQEVVNKASNTTNY